MDPSCWPQPNQAHNEMHGCRQNFINHGDETDPERLQEIMAQARQNAQWVLEKARALVPRRCARCGWHASEQQVVQYAVKQ